MFNFFINKSINDNAYSMVITPDHVYGNGSIYNLFKLVEGKDIGIGCIGARINLIHIRNYRHYWKKIYQYQIKNWSNLL